MQQPSKLRNCLKGALVAAGLLSMMPAHAFILIDNYDVYLDATGPGGANDASVFLGGTGGSLTEIDAFQSDGNSYVIQQATGAGGTVQTGDRFYEVGYLRLSTADVGGSTTGLGGLYGGGDNSLYFFFELGGSVTFGATPTYSIDRGVISLMLDNDGGLLAGNLDPLMNRAEDGESFMSLMTRFEADLAATAFAMPGAGGGNIDPTAGVATTDATILELIRLQFLAGSGGEVPTGFNIPNSQTTGDFGVDMAALTTQCVSEVFYNEAGVDLCSLANVNPLLSGFLWSVSGQTTGKNINDANIYTYGGSSYITQTLTIGDTADIGAVPEPGMLFLMGAGLLGLGVARRRKTV